MIKYRQGDIGLKPADAIPEDAKPIERDGGRIVLAYGEATGHAHAIHDPHAGFFIAEGARRFLSLAKPATLRHEEHSHIELPAGNYEVVRQREYSPEEIRVVAD